MIFGGLLRVFCWFSTGFWLFLLQQMFFLNKVDHRHLCFSEEV